MFDVKKDEWSLNDVLSLFPEEQHEQLSELLHAAVKSKKLQARRDFRKIQVPSRYFDEETDDSFKEVWFFNPTEFIEWATSKQLKLPKEVLDWHAAQSKPPVLESVDWKPAAWGIALTIYKKNPLLSVDRIAEKTHTEMQEKGIAGRGGKIPSVDTIKRHALTGIKA